MFCDEVARHIVYGSDAIALLCTANGKVFISLLGDAHGAHDDRRKSGPDA